MKECLDVANRLTTKFSHYSQQLNYSILIYTMKYHVKSMFELSTSSIQKLFHFLIAERVQVICSSHHPSQNEIWVARDNQT